MNLFLSFVYKVQTILVVCCLLVREIKSVSVVFEHRFKYVKIWMPTSPTLFSTDLQNCKHDFSVVLDVLPKYAMMTYFVPHGSTKL